MIRAVKARIIPLIILASLLVILTGKLITASHLPRSRLLLAGGVVTARSRYRNESSIKMGNCPE
jgi:hypothetical protein